jgi:hypothetical protein
MVYESNSKALGLVMRYAGVEKCDHIKKKKVKHEHSLNQSNSD